METDLNQHQHFATERKRMIREQLSEFPSPVRAAMDQLPRHEFVPRNQQPLAYADRPLPIGYNQTISQPYIVALMTTRLDPPPAGRVLEIGTGSGYQAAVLAALGTEVFTIEIIVPLAQRAEANLHRLGCRNVHLRTGDGFAGWPEAAPFDGILVTCAPEKVPVPLIAQLKDGARLIIPLGPPGRQELMVLQKRGGQLVANDVCPVRFVPMTGEAEHGEE